MSRECLIEPSSHDMLRSISRNHVAHAKDKGGSECLSDETSSLLPL